MPLISLGGGESNAKQRVASPVRALFPSKRSEKKTLHVRRMCTLASRWTAWQDTRRPAQHDDECKW